MHSTNPAVSVAASAVSLTLLQRSFPVQLRTAWRRFPVNERTIAPAAGRRIRVTPPLQSPLVNRPQRKESQMKIDSVVQMCSVPNRASSAKSQQRPWRCRSSTWRSNMTVTVSGSACLTAAFLAAMVCTPIPASAAVVNRGTEGAPLGDSAGAQVNLSRPGGHHRRAGAV